MTKKIIFIFLFAGLLSLHGKGQISDAEILLLKKLDSIKESSSIAKHFAALYFNVTNRAADFFLNKKKEDKQFIQRLETRFASFFFRSAEADARHLTVPAEWKDYFADTGLSRLQYQLLGINAHINGDIWQALTTEFSLDEIKKGRKTYFSFQKGLAKEYKNFYEESFNASEKIRLLHVSTVGIDKQYGKWMLKRWRHRQMRLAILYYSNRQRFEHKLAQLRQKMDRINRLILHSL